MVTILGILLIVVLLFGVPLVFVVSFVAARARKELAEEASKAEAAATDDGEDGAAGDAPPD